MRKRIEETVDVVFRCREYLDRMAREHADSDGELDESAVVPMDLDRAINDAVREIASEHGVEVSTVLSNISRHHEDCSIGTFKDEVKDHLSGGSKLKDRLSKLSDLTDEEKEALKNM